MDYARLVLTIFTASVVALALYWCMYLIFHERKGKRDDRSRVETISR